MDADGTTATSDTREYAERLTRLRLHQPVFRAQVLAAYDRACTICRLQHVDLLDAAHILSDADGGQPVVPNGMAMCKIHHAAYDRGILGVRPDYVVQIRPDVLAEVDGPMLRHGLQDVHGWSLGDGRRRMHSRHATRTSRVDPQPADRPGHRAHAAPLHPSCQQSAAIGCSRTAFWRDCGHLAASTGAPCFARRGALAFRHRRPTA